jgi:hypothetical protein
LRVGASAPTLKISDSNFGELRQREVRRIHLLITSVNKAASVSVYKGRHLFGARERKNEVLGQSPSPELRKRLTS